MIYSKEVEEMCPVAQGVHHGCAPIPEEAKWVQAKEVKDISISCLCFNLLDVIGLKYFCNYII